MTRSLTKSRRILNSLRHSALAIVPLSRLWLSPLVLPLTLATPLFTGCASNTLGDSRHYQESATDVANRAPSSMTIPESAAKSDEGTDAFHSRAKADYHFALGESYALDGSPARAIEEYKMTLVYDPSSTSVHLKLAAEYVRQGLVGEAVEQAKAAIETDPKNEDAHLLLGGLYSAMRTYDESLKEYREVKRLNPENAEAPMFTGAILAEQKKFTEAIAEFEALAKRPVGSNTHLAYFYLGRIYLEQSEGKASGKAEQAFRRSLALKPSFADAAIALSQLMDTANRRPQAIRLLADFQAKHGPNSSVAEDLVRHYIDAKDYNGAYAQLEIIEKADPDDVGARTKMAYILIEQQKYAPAILRLEDILAKDASLDRPRFYLGAVYEEIKDYKSAIKNFEKIQFGSSYFQEAVVHTSYLYKLGNDYAKATSTIENAIKTQDDYAPFYALYASLLDDQKQYEKGVAMLKFATQKFADNAQLRFYLGSMQDRVGDRESTVTNMKEVLKLDHDHVAALNFLAYIYAERGINLPEAESMVRHAHSLQPGDGYIMDTLGWVMYKQGKVQDAIKMLEAAYKTQPDESVIAEHLADAYYQQQMPERAKRLYLKAAGLESNAQTVAKIREKIVAIDRQTQVLGDESAQSSRQPASERAH